MKVANVANMFRTLRYILYPSWTALNEAKMGKILLMIQTKPNEFLRRTFKYHNFLLSQEKYIRDPSTIVKKDGTIIRKKTPQNVMINLIKDSEVTVLPLKAAESIAKAKGLNLVKVVEKIKSRKETYKLVPDSKLGIDESLIQPKNKENLKTIIISSGIFEHDLQIKIKSMMKILCKHLKVKCIIKKLSNTGSVTALYEKILEELKKEDLSLSTTVMKSTNDAMHFVIKNEPQKHKEIENGNIKKMTETVE